MGDPPSKGSHSSSSPTPSGTASSLSVPAAAHAASVIGSTHDTRWGCTTTNVNTTRLADEQVARDHPTHQGAGLTGRSQRDTTRAGRAGMELFDDLVDAAAAPGAFRRSPTPQPTVGFSVQSPRPSTSPSAEGSSMREVQQQQLAAGALGMSRSSPVPRDPIMIAAAHSAITRSFAGTMPRTTDPTSRCCPRHTRFGSNGSGTAVG